MVTEERKVVTVLFCDLVDFTASADGADPEDVRARLRPYHGRVRQEIERYGGTVEKFIGDAVMAVYGAPIVHEDDAERAVRSALRVIEGIADLNEEHPALSLQVRIGIATGEAVVTLGARPEQGEGMVAGDVVNTASRLQGAAAVGGVVVDQQTYRRTESLFDYAALDPVTLKGKAEPAQIWQPLAPRSRLGADVARRYATPLIGRELERRLLIDAFERSVREHTPQLVTIVGEPGVGKSRLVGELFAHIDALPELIRWRQGRCLPYGEGITFWALGEIVKAETGVLETDPAEVSIAKLDAALPEGPDREWLRQRLLPLMGLEASSTAERGELFTAWRRFLESLAEDGPTILVFEDLHWADDAMLAFLEHLAEWSEGVPLLVLGTARPELYEGHRTWAATARNSARINLAPLSEGETTRLIALLLDQAVLPAEVQSLIVERAGGNPLYAEEFVRLLRDRGLLVARGLIVGLAPGADVPFPETIHALIAARLDTLSAERKAILQDAAVIGKVFWSGAVAAMGGLDRGMVVEALHELSRKELVRPMRSSSMEGEAEYAFWHVLVRDVAYGEIPRARRVERHRRAAAWIETRAGERVEDHAEILAHHYTTALQLARATGDPDVAAIEASALRFLLMSGERALGLDTAKAEAALARALEFAPPGHPRRPDVLVRWADAARHANRHREAAAALEEAIASFRTAGETVRAAQALTTLGNVRWQMGDPRSRRTAAEAVTLLETLAPRPELVAAYAEMARLEHLAGESREAITSSKRAMAIARDLGLGEQAKPLGYLGNSRLEIGEPEGLDEMRRAALIALESGQGGDAAILSNNVADGTSQMEGPAAGLALYRQGIDFAERRGITEVALWMAAEAAGQLVRVGSLREALTWAEQLAERFEAGGAVNGLVRSRCVKALVLAYQGRAGEAVPLVDWAVEGASRGGAIEGIAMSLPIAALVHLANGDAEGAVRLLARLVDNEHATHASTYGYYLPDAVRTAVGAGDVTLAGRLAGAAPAALPGNQHAEVTARAIVAEARQEFSEAIDTYAEAATRWERFGVVTERAFALLGQGRCLVSLGRPGEAEEPLRQARGLFAAMGMRPALAETGALIEKTATLAS